MPHRRQNPVQIRLRQPRRDRSLETATVPEVLADPEALVAVPVALVVAVESVALILVT